MSLKVPYINLTIQHKRLAGEVMPKVEAFIKSGQFILGDSVKKFEESFAIFHNVKFGVGVANGTDALILAIKSLGIKDKDEVITAPNSFLASASSIVLAGATPVFCDVDDDMNIDPSILEEVITNKTKAIMPVHLTGKPARMDEINAIAQKHGLYIIEDAAQAVGASINNRHVGSIGDIGCFSLHPLKNLSACGDAGIITTNNEDIYKHLLSARNHGLINRDKSHFFSVNSRLDALQAEILNVKMKYIEEWNNRRREIASKYTEAFESLVITPTINEKEHAVFHTYIIQTPKRDELQRFLTSIGIDTKVHYPIPIHQQKAWSNYTSKSNSFPKTEKQSKEILSLPIFPELTNEQVDYVIQGVCQFFNE